MDTSNHITIWIKYTYTKDMGHVWIPMMLSDLHIFTYFNEEKMQDKILVFSSKKKANELISKMCEIKSHNYKKSHFKIKSLDNTLTVDQSTIK